MQQQQKAESSTRRLSTSQTDDDQASDVDRGYAWVILICCTILKGASTGPAFTLGVFVTDWTESFQASNREAFLVVSLHVGVFLTGGALAVWLIARYGYRRVAIVGALLSSSGFLSAGLVATRLWHLMPTLGFLAAIGGSMVNVVAFSLSGQFFERRRHLWSAVIAMPASIGGFVCAPLFRMLADRYGWHWALCIWAAMSALLMLPCLVLLRERPSVPPPPQAAATIEPPDSTKRRAKVMRRPELWLWVLAKGLSASMQMGRAILPKFCESELGMTPTMSAMSLSVGSASSMLARLLFLLAISTGLQRYAKPLVIHCCASTLVAVNFLAMGFANGAVMLFVLVASGDAMAGTMHSTLGGAMTDVFGSKSLAVVYGASLFTVGTIGMIAPVSAGIVADLTGSFRPALIAGGICATLGACIYMLILSRHYGSKRRAREARLSAAALLANAT